MYCLSKLDGIPTKYEDAVRQYNQNIQDSKNRSMFLFDGYLVFKKHVGGVYNGLCSTFYYKTKPKNYITIYKIV